MIYWNDFNAPSIGTDPAEYARSRERTTSTGGKRQGLGFRGQENGLVGSTAFQTNDRVSVLIDGPSEQGSSKQRRLTECSPHFSQADASHSISNPAPTFQPDLRLHTSPTIPPERPEPTTTVDQQMPAVEIFERDQGMLESQAAVEEDEEEPGEPEQEPPEPEPT